MSFIDSEELPLRFGSILVITYGRSGSTLLQGLLNSIEGVVLRGENMNMCFHLFKTYQAILESKTHDGKITQNPFFGSSKLDEEYFLRQSKETVKNLLLGDRINDSTVKCYGFKEIRYIHILNDLSKYLKFLKKIFPNPCFIFNTRNNEDVVNSWIKLGWQPESYKEKGIKRLNKAEVAFVNAMEENKNNSFHITYEDIVNKTNRVKSLFSFLGAPYTNENADSILALRHSYKLKPGTINKIENSANDATEGNYRLQKNILVEKYKFIIFIIPKNASTSFKVQIVDVLALKNLTNSQDSVHDPNVYPFPFVKISELNDRYKEYLRFCVVRNPWDRIVSCFKDKIRPIDFNSDDFRNGVALPLMETSSFFYGGMPFDEFVDVVCQIPDSIGEHHFTSQLYQITDAYGNLLVNFISKLETLNEDLETLSQKTGFPIANFPHVHKTKGKKYQEYYNDELIEKVRIRYKADIGFFNYEYDQRSNVKIGFVTDEIKETLTNSNWMVSILANKIRHLKNDKISIDRLKIKIKTKELWLQQLQNSLSWKITAPLRKLGSLLGYGQKN